MKKLEQLRFVAATEQDAQRLLRWLYEWELLCLPDTQASETNTAMRGADNPYGDSVAPIDSELGVGEIRLLPPHGDDIPVFIAIASIEPDGSSVCVPFSPLGEPATPDELLSGRDTPVIRVFCLWNARTMTGAHIRNSWISDELSPLELDRLLRALAACRCDGHVPSDLLADAGPPLVHPEDPRRDYRHSERQRIDRALVCESRASIIHYDAKPECRELPKAAEDHDPYEV